MKKLLVFAAMLLASSLVSAATVNLSWVNPTQTTAGGPLTGNDALTKFQFFIGTSPTLSTTPSVEVPAVSPLQTTYSFTANPGDTIYAAMTACNLAGCSVKSVTVSKAIPFPAAAPGTPQSITINVSIP